ncbi:MAG: DUF5313 family protein [Mycobacteriaceae bacterium]
MSEHHPRPNPAQWVGYAFGRGLPSRMLPWVRHDLMGDRWVLRHLVRTLAQWAPSLALLALPGPVGLRLSLPLLVLVGCMYVSVSYLDETRTHRLLKHGIDPAEASVADAARRAESEVVAEAELAVRRAAARRGRDRSFRQW